MPDTVTSLFDRAFALLLSGGFLFAVVGTGSLYGKLHAYDVGVGLLAAALLTGWLMSPRSLPLTRWDIVLMAAIVALACVMAIVPATLLSETPRPVIQLFFLARVVGLFVVFLGFVFLASRWPATTRTAFVLTGVFLLAYAVHAAITGNFTGYYDYLDIPGTSAPLQSGFAFGILAALFLGLAVIAPSTPARGGYLLLAFGLAFAAIGTVSRTNTIAVAFTSMLTPLVWAVFRRKYRQTLLVCLGLGALIGAVGLGYLAEALPEPLQGPMEATFRRLGKFEASSNLRFREWASYFADAPVNVAVYWLTGLGVGAQSVLSRVDAGFTLRFDSLYLRLFFEWGAIGLALWTAFFLHLLSRVRRCASSFAVPLFLTLVYGGVVAVTHEWLFVGVSGYLYMAISGALLGWAEAVRPRRAESAAER
ncbi:MAG: hypothetical protein DWQ08_10995 [Proteobacteria bacterium]|nr:MAG: hypothetical protein DWQ08_10995 [Pseudomonadota bacterium]